MAFLPGAAAAVAEVDVGVAAEVVVEGVEANQNGIENKQFQPERMRCATQFCSQMAYHWVLQPEWLCRTQEVL